jgi:ribonuclease VapC
MEIRMVDVAPETARIALDAFDRYGKGRHPARLNFGDCFAYACARHLGEPLMFKGSDFPQTDIEAA